MLAITFFVPRFTIFFLLFVDLQVESMKKKLPWLKYDMKKVEYIQSKEQETVAMKNLEEEATILNKLREPIEYVIIWLLILNVWRNNAADYSIDIIRFMMIKGRSLSPFDFC